MDVAVNPPLVDVKLPNVFWHHTMSLNAKLRRSINLTSFAEFLYLFLLRWSFKVCNNIQHEPEIIRFTFYYLTSINIFSVVSIFHRSSLLFHRAIASTSIFLLPRHKVEIVYESFIFFGNAFSGSLGMVVAHQSTKCGI